MVADLLHKIRIWDLPTRAFHWALALCCVGLLVTGKMGGDMMPWHARLGLLVAALLLFRLLWGFVGGHWSRFQTFFFHPRAVVQYLKGTAGPGLSVGHNPMGALSVFALLFFLAVQVTTGLFSDDRADFAGPLSPLVRNATVRLLTSYHRNAGQFILIALVLLHLAAIAWYQWQKKQDLIGAMVHGDKYLPRPGPSSQDGISSRLWALALFGICAAFVWWVASLGG